MKKVISVIFWLMFYVACGFGFYYCYSNDYSLTKKFTVFKEKLINTQNTVKNTEYVLNCLSVSRGIERCENKEVICYKHYSDIECKYK